MTRLMVLAWAVAFCSLPHSALGVESDADALPPGAVARLGWSPLRVGYSSTFTLTPDGRTIVVVTPQGNLRRLDAQTGRLLERRQLTDRRDVDPGDGTMIDPALLSANGETAAFYEVSDTGPHVRVYEVASGKKIFERVTTEKQIAPFGGLSPDGKQLAVIESENKKTYLRLFDLKTGNMKEIGPFPGRLLGLHFSTDGKRLFVTVQDRTKTKGYYIFNRPAPHIVTAFDLRSGKELCRCIVWAMSFDVSHDGKMVAASGCPNEDSWDSEPGFARGPKGYASGFHVLEMGIEAKKLTARFVPCQLGSGVFANFSLANFMLAPDKHTIVISHFDDHGAASIVSWDLRTRKEIRRFPLPQTKSGQLIPPAMALSADGRTLLTAADYLQRWDLTTGKPFFAPPPDDALPGSLLQVAFTPDGKEVFASALGNVSGRWNVKAGKRIDLIPDHYSGQRLIRTPDGLRIVREEARPDNMFELAILDPVAHKTLRMMRNTPANEGFGYATLSADGKKLLAIKADKNSRRVTIWDVAAGRKLSSFALAGASPCPKTPFSPCGRWMFVNGKLYHTGSGAELFQPAVAHGEQISYADPYGRDPIWFSDDGRLMAARVRKTEAATGAEETLVVWELASGQVLTRFPKARFIAQAAFAPDGRTIALLDAQGVRMEDILTGKRLAKYPAPDVIHGFSGDEMQGIVFAPDASTLATGHHDGSILLWKVPRSRDTASVPPADGEIEKLWTELKSSTPNTARAAIKRLARHADATMAVLTVRFRPPPADDKLAALLKDLDSDSFSTREDASHQIRAYGARAEPALRRTLAQLPSLEMRRRIEGILADMPPLPLRLPLSGERLRGVRAIEVLERIGNAAARKLLQSWAEQTEEGHLAIEARLALERLAPANAKPKSAENTPSP